MNEKSIQRQIDEHLGLNGPKPKLTAAWLAAELREIAENEGEHSVNNAFVLEEAAAHLSDLAMAAKRLLDEFISLHEFAYPSDTHGASLLRDGKVLSINKMREALKEGA